MTGRSSVQAPASVVMVRPHRFRPNPATTADNAFQASPRARDADEVARAAHDEVTALAVRLEAARVTVHLFDDTSETRPDAVFPNNWFSTHADGRVAIYPMYAPSRRAERRADVIDLLKRRYRVREVIDYAGLEEENVFLEGTGAMVLDHRDRVAYAARSNRMSGAALARFCADFGYEPVVFDTADRAGRPVYHTNVLMTLGTDVCLIALGMIPDAAWQAEVAARLESSGRALIDLREDQVSDFAGNAIELSGEHGPFLVMSRRGLDALTPTQRAAIESRLSILAADVPTIELAGGSVRCMIAGVHLEGRGEGGSVKHDTGREAARARRRRL